MGAKVYIRISAILIIIHLLGHTMGHSGWDDENGALYEVVKSMKSQSAEFMGATKSMADYYNGFSIIIFGLYIMTIWVLWILSNYAATNQRMVKQILYPIGLTYLFFGLVEYIYFFPFAATLSGLAGLFLLLTTLKLNNR